MVTNQKIKLFRSCFLELSMRFDNLYLGVSKMDIFTNITDIYLVFWKLQLRYHIQFLLIPNYFYKTTFQVYNVDTKTPVLYNYIQPQLTTSQRIQQKYQTLWNMEPKPCNQISNVIVLSFLQDDKRKITSKFMPL